MFKIMKNRGIKNFYVEAQTIKNKDKGLFDYITYLTNENHSNHKNKCEKIEKIYGNRRDFRLSLIERVKDRELTTNQTLKGGSPIQSYRHSYCFSFPTNTEIKKEEIFKIFEILITDLRNELNINKQILLKSCFRNIHYNKNIHINLVISKILVDKTFMSNLTIKKRIINSMKRSFNFRNKKILGLDNKKYIQQNEPLKEEKQKINENEEKKRLYEKFDGWFEKDNKTTWKNDLKKYIRYKYQDKYDLNTKLHKNVLNLIDRYRKLILKENKSKEDLEKIQKQKININKNIEKIKNESPGAAEELEKIYNSFSL